MKLTKYAAAAVLAAGITLSAHSAIYDFDTIQSGATPAGAAPWATLTVNQVASGVVSLRLDAVNLPGTEFLSLFEYNIAGSGAVTAAVNLPLGGVDPTTGANNGFHFGPINDANLSFNADVDFPPPSGAFALKFTNGEFFSWTLSRSGLSVADITGPMMIHIQGIAPSGSSKVTASLRNVPDGGSTLALVGLAIAGLGLARRKLS